MHTPLHSLSTLDMSYSYSFLSLDYMNSASTVPDNIYKNPMTLAIAEEYGTYLVDSNHSLVDDLIFYQ